MPPSILPSVRAIEQRLGHHLGALCRVTIAFPGGGDGARDQRT
jgi:hypothetical protein